MTDKTPESHLDSIRMADLDKLQPTSFEDFVKKE